MIDHPYPSSSYFARVTNIVKSTNVTPAITHDDSLAVLVYIYISSNSKFSSTKMMLGISLNRWKNLDTEMVVGKDEAQPIKLI